MVLILDEEKNKEKLGEISEATLQSMCALRGDKIRRHAHVCRGIMLPALNHNDPITYVISTNKHIMLRLRLINFIVGYSTYKTWLAVSPALLLFSSCGL